jgi:hypothetical protein
VGLLADTRSCGKRWRRRAPAAFMPWGEIRIGGRGRGGVPAVSAPHRGGEGGQHRLGCGGWRACTVGAGD